jgi:hypothetical protein
VALTLFDRIAAILPKGQLTGDAWEIVDVIRIWKFFGFLLRVAEEQITPSLSQPG